MKNNLRNEKSYQKLNNQAGFTLIEAVMAIVILLITLLGVFSVFTYAIVYNTGNNTRSQSLSVLQREIELVRSAKFTPAGTDDSILGGTRAAKNILSGDNSSYKVEVTVDDDPLIDGIQIDSTKSLKEITVTVTPTNKVASWQTAVASSVTMRRVRGN
jgi:prepilin-type N-terminal cleavage/methylation domain-containing protein